METDSGKTLQADFDAFDISEELECILKEPVVSLLVIIFVPKQQTFCFNQKNTQKTKIRIRQDAITTLVK